MSQNSGSPTMDGLLGALGLPNPQAVVQELQRLNTSLEIMRPDIHAIAEGIGSIKELAQASKKFTPQDLNRLVTSLDRASTVGENIYTQMWGNRK